MKKRLSQSSVKEAFDNLPSGVCYFSEKGMPVLCNRVMQNFMHTLTGHSLQTETELMEIVEGLPENSLAKKDGDAYILPDGTVWKIYHHQIKAEGCFTEYFVENITELYYRKKELNESTELQQRMVSDMKRIVDNVVDITREEEILAMKMQVHGKVGWFLQRLRNYHLNDCPENQRDAVVKELREITSSLYKEIGKDDEADSWAELLRVSKPLGITVSVIGKMPDTPKFKNILVMAVRECISNTVRHAEGNLVKVEIVPSEKVIAIKITNNGKQPMGVIKEGGGFSSLRKNLEKNGCAMKIESQPIFALIVTVPKESEE